ncbi:MAG: hypothetical protein ACRER2_05125, partial [Methylococcales bacterium]
FYRRGAFAHSVQAVKRMQFRVTGYPPARIEGAVTGLFRDVPQEPDNTQSPADKRNENILKKFFKKGIDNSRLIEGMCLGCCLPGLWIPAIPAGTTVLLVS